MESHAEGLFVSATCSISAVIVGMNAAPSCTILQEGTVVVLQLAQDHIMTGVGPVIIRGVFAGKQSSVLVTYPDKNHIRVVCEQKTTLGLAETGFMVIPVRWDFGFNY